MIWPVNGIKTGTGTMFEVGREYLFVSGSGEDEGSWVGEVLEVNLPLIKVSGPDGDIILNTSAASFIAARALPPRSKEEREAARAKWKGPPSDADEA
jgi:hypothetical protein